MTVIKLLFLSCLFVYSQCANILFVVPFQIKSHYIMLRPIGLELARRGHNVTAITAIKEKDPPKNYHEVMVDEINIWDVVEGGRPNIFTMASMPTERYLETIWAFALSLTEVALNSTQVQKLLNSDHKFELVICEQFYEEAFYILAHKYQAPLALVTTYGNCMRHNIAVRNPLQVATVNLEFLNGEVMPSFLGRFKNFYYSVYDFIWWKHYFLPKQEKLISKYVKNLPVPVPSLYEMQGKASLMLMNSHFSFNPLTAYLPNMIEIGGIHLSKSIEELPKDLKAILDNSKNGVVYMNFGTTVKSSELPDDKKNAFLNVFRRLNQTVLWKWEDDNLENIPENLITRSWFPQREVLAHPNIKLFISHGGLLGTQEAVYYGVPIIGVPIFADQYNNLLLVQEKGFGKMLKYSDINEEYLETLIVNVLNNDVYKRKAIEVSQRFKDRPMSPIDTAMFWLEYLIRHKNAEELTNPSMKLTWMKYTMVDVYLFIIFIIFMFIYLVVYMAKMAKLLLFKKNVNLKKKNR